MKVIIFSNIELAASRYLSFKTSKMFNVYYMKCLLHDYNKHFPENLA